MTGSHLYLWLETSVLIFDKMLCVCQIFITLVMCSFLALLPGTPCFQHVNPLGQGSCLSVCTLSSTLQELREDKVQGTE